MRASGRLLFPLLLTLCALVATTAADVKDDLQKRGVRITTSTATFASESALGNQLRDVATLRRKLIQATSQYNDQKKGADALNVQITRMNQQLVALNAQLVNVQDVVTNNRLVGAISAIEGQLRLAYDRAEQQAKQEATLHGQVSTARDALMTHVLEMRKLADDVSAKYRTIDKETQDLIARFNTENKCTVTLQPSPVFLANVRKLEQHESEMLSEVVPLRRDGSTYWASVKVNGEQLIDMVVDSGANIVLLPFDDAAKAGIKPGDDAPLVRIGVADGRTTTAKMMTIKSLQLGQFIAEDVECVVLDPGIKAAPLLGMSFLGRFKFQLDAGKSQLSLVRFGESAGKTAAGRRPPLFEVTNSEWKLIPATAGALSWNDRPSKVEQLPKELEDTLIVVRDWTNREWLAGEVVASKPAWVYVGLLHQYTLKKNGKTVVNFRKPTVDNLEAQGWKQIEGFSVEPTTEEGCKWMLFGKQFGPGPINIPAPVTIQTRMVFFVGPDATPAAGKAVD